MPAKYIPVPAADRKKPGRKKVKRDPASLAAALEAVPPTPGSFTEARAGEICERLAQGEPLMQICRSAGMPADRTVRYWADPSSREYKGESFSSAIAHARARGFDAIAESCLDIADDSRNDWVERQGQQGEAGGMQINSEHIQRSKLRIETRLKLLAKWDPKRYGDKLETTHTGRLTVAQEMTDDALARIAAGSGG